MQQYSIHELNLRIQSKYGKIRTRKYSVFGHFLRSAFNLRLDHKEMIVHLNYQEKLIKIFNSAFAINFNKQKPNWKFLTM